ncbi:54S ribosomal protein img2, mitochondrial [Yamadazyma tenuis]|uniref:Large ribosomal subunit protein mL49 n=1 Tax=Candida tenuis (strain ATCC 10573 / BCRC 21748 / CBS 615 / JCM 9827 / NBRC 10315 / NRRL Y-1498 / VKM Y-70) TaxID=590646 RepID=G3BAC5_CANTC|nr:uncharacterized protein CANTEDRAFT_109031 [Yamadazyma tenuis ATCC 10573]EGV62027.1 hypothetical protein CANTEDRAFT_109031 [Yamadazyma tenuis ATCC 10573]WEJ93273.1 54S ribosomal protein img2, mitochondrial [Yamadazyma tenuis]
MKPSPTVLRTIKPRSPSVPEPVFQIPSLSLISFADLPNNGFGNGNYFISKTKFGHWPIYKKVQNTKITTEIKRIQGDVLQFKKDLVSLTRLNPKFVTVNQTAGYVNVKGDEVERLRSVFDKHIN